MKNKRRGLILLILVLVMTLGIGYAAVSTSTITLNGSASAVKDDFNIIYDTTKAITYSKSSTTGLTVSGEYTSTTVATMTVSGLKVKDDYAEANYAVKNNSSSLKANISASVTTPVTDTQHFSVVLSYSTDGTTYNTTAPTNVAAGAVVYVKARVNLIKSFADDPAAQTFTVTITGTAVSE
jgi:hypothetical protein